jgi:hypothetical protein
MKKDKIIEMQKKLGVTPDGFWGPASIAACQKHLRALMPDVNPWPKADPASMNAFYGQAGDESQLVELLLPEGFTYDGKPMRRTRCHKKVRDSLSRILPKVVHLAKDYGGIFNFRKMRGGSSLSIHSWGSAIDLDTGSNGNKTSWPAVATMPLEVMEEFAKEGWLPAGAFWGRDAMHFQATK